jgi:diacylglycerol kinase (ATP)
MPTDLSTQSPNYTNGQVVATPATPKPNRDLSWQVATNLLVSFKYAWAGIVYAFQTQRNFRIHVFIGALAIALGVSLSLNAVEIAVLGLTIGAVLAVELLNTAIESVVDLTVKQSYHDLAKIAKDCAAAAVLISALVAILVAGSLILPKLWLLLRPFLSQVI